MPGGRCHFLQPLPHLKLPSLEPLYIGPPTFHLESAVKQPFSKITSHLPLSSSKPLQTFNWDRSNSQQKNTPRSSAETPHTVKTIAVLLWLFNNQRAQLPEGHSGALPLTCFLKNILQSHQMKFNPTWRPRRRTPAMPAMAKGRPSPAMARTTDSYWLSYNFGLLESIPRQR